MRRLLLTLTLAACAGGVQAERFVLAKAALELHDDAGRTLARHAMRVKHMDQRSDDGMLAVLQDADSGRIELWRAAAGHLQREAAWPAPALEVEQLCLHRDRQGLLQLFLLGSEGLSEQWLIHGARALPVQRLATPLEPSACRVRDAEAQLYVAEPGVGLWALSANAERPGRRLLVAEPLLGDKALNARLGAWLAEHPPAAPAAPAAWPPVVLPTGQTQPMREDGDAADDPAIWVHPARGARSLILATDKKRGLVVYGLDGRERQFLPVGRINNVDLRQGLVYGGRRLDLAVATQRDEAGLVLFGISPAGRVSELARLRTTLDDIYGVCVGRNADGGLDVFPNDKDGRVQRLRLRLAGRNWRAEPVAEFRLDSQPEGCVVDEANQALFVGEEKRGVWRQDLATSGSAPQLVITAGPGLVPDVEGLAIHPERGWLVVSSQGSDSYAVYDIKPPFAQRGTFAIGTNATLGIDGVSETDGLDLTPANLGGPYKDGVLVVQDGHKRLPQGPQNFKLVPWAAVERAVRRPSIVQ
jgi:3-phytase